MNAWFSSLSPFLSAFHFLRPGWLWALLALPLLVGWWWRSRRQQNVWREVVDPHLLRSLLERSGGGRRMLVFWGMALAYSLAVLALAGPSWRQGEQPLWQPRLPLVIALDLSSTIVAADLPPSRLLQARAKIASLLQQREGGQIALVAYADDAFTVAPLTDDAANVVLFLDALGPEVMPVDGQRSDRAIAWSARLLRQVGAERGQILLLTDHADAAAHAAAREAAKQGYQVLALGLGTAIGTDYQDGYSGMAHARLDAGSLRAMAAAGQGHYETLARDDSDLLALGVLSPGVGQGELARGEKGTAWLDQGYWLLLPLMLLLLPAFRRGHSVLPLLALCLLLPVAMPAQAVEGGWWQRADQRQQQLLDQGAQAYRQGDFAGAQRAFEQVDTDEGHYNRGNALARQGQYDQAIAAYDEVMKRHPQMADAVANRAAVEAARKRQQQNQQNQQSGSAQQDGQPPQDSSGAENKPENEQDGKSRQAKGSQSDPDKSAQPGKPEDAKAQEQADAAQRERMHQAMKEQTGKEGDEKTDPAGNVSAKETAQERERRQALEAWLQRVPDDPGGLLRAKFELEHRRRQGEGQ